MEEQFSELVTAHLRYAYGVAAKFFRWAVAVGVDSDDVRGEARLALVQAAVRYIQQPEGDFKAYLAKTIDCQVRAFLSNNSHVLAFKKRGYLRGMIWRVSTEVGKDISNWGPEEIAMAAKLLGTSVEVLRAVWERRVVHDISFDSLKGGEGVERTWGEVLTMPAEETDGRPFYMTPEQILLAQEEARAANRFRKSPEMERKLLYSWLEFLPKRHSQVLRHRYVYMKGPHHKRHLSPNSYRSLCKKSCGGTSAAGLAITPAQAQAIEAEAIAMLRRFARGDFTGADFTRVVRRVPIPLIQRFMGALEDGATRMALEYGLVKTYVAKETKSGDQVLTHGSLKVVARVWRTRLSGELGKELSKEEAEQEIRRRFALACKALAIQVGIAPARENKREVATGEEELIAVAA